MEKMVNQLHKCFTNIMADIPAKVIELEISHPNALLQHLQQA